jgi:N-acetylmuramoyl-L-alanine amidase
MVLTAIFAFSVCVEAAAQHKNFILVIDPGHGGQDPGATSGRYLEKDINLQTALALGSLITRSVPGVDVLYTRTEDRAVGLAARGDFANRAGADLFLSIHTNANRSSSPNGSETYVMGMDKSDENLAVAKLENEVMRYEQDYTETYAAFDPSSAEMSIIMGMMQYANFEGSLEFARLVQKRFAASTPLRDRGAKQGPFAVLWKPTMPRVLVEMGFISNDADRRYIFSDRGNEAVVKALYEAFREYKAARDAEPAPTPAQILAQMPPAPVTAALPVQATQPEIPPAPAYIPSPAPVPEVRESSNRYTTATPPPREEDRTRLTPIVTSREPAEFYVQLAASHSSISTYDTSWDPYRGQVVERIIDGWYKYALGPFTQREAAAKLQEVRRTKFRDAFIVK